MVARDAPWPAGTPCWMDVTAADMAQATAFYRGLFGWDVRDGTLETGNYAMCEIGGRPVAGIAQVTAEEMPACWTTYLATDDADATAAKIEAAGGSLLMDPVDLMDVGRMTIAVDPGGARFAIWQARAHTGMRLANEPGTLIWSDNMSRAFEANKAFYRAVFGYQFGAIGGEGSRYSTLDIDGKAVGGIGEIGADEPAERPASWGVYFAVADTDAAVARVAELGGSVAEAAWDSPYGRMALVRDDQGALFTLMSATTPDQS